LCHFRETWLFDGNIHMPVSRYFGIVRWMVEVNSGALKK